MNNNVTSKEQILATAKEILCNEGMDKLNIRNLAEKCNVSVGVFYNYFGNKSDLLFAIVAEFWNSIYLQAPPATASESFCEYIDYLYQSMSSKFFEFEVAILNHLSILDASEKQKGKKFEEECFAQIKEQMTNALHNDININPNLWKSDLTQAEFIDHIFLNIISLLQKEAKSCNTLLKIINKILY